MTLGLPYNFKNNIDFDR